MYNVMLYERYLRAQSGLCDTNCVLFCNLTQAFVPNKIYAVNTCIITEVYG